MLIHFTDVIGIEVRENSIVMDLKSRPKIEKKFHTKERENGKRGGGKWTEENMHVEEGSSPNRIEVVIVGRREPVMAKLQEVLSKVPSLKQAINRELATVYHNVYDQQILEDRLSCSPGSNVSYGRTAGLFASIDCTPFVKQSRVCY